MTSQFLRRGPAVLLVAVTILAAGTVRAQTFGVELHNTLMPASSGNSVIPPPRRSKATGLGSG